jgi:serine/threonine protein phosphatase PrpC
MSCRVLPRAELAVARLVVGREDRAAHFATSGGDVFVVADGAGGTGGGAAAAEAVIAAVGASVIGDALGWVELLARVDREMKLGETTAVVCSVVGDTIVGASVGDSGAWRIEDGAIDDLTHAQRRKPLLGSGRAVVVPFTARLGSATLLLASDGLLKYASAERIAACVGGVDLDAVARDLVDLVRLRSGALPDDIAIVLSRRR